MRVMERIGLVMLVALLSATVSASSGSDGHDDSGRGVSSSHGDEPASHGANASPAASSDHDEVHWEYSGASGPAHWGETCQSGMRQSPVNLRHATGTEDLYDLSFNYGSVILQVVNNGHTVQANTRRLNEETVEIGDETYSLVTKPIYDSTMIVGGTPYNLVQFHFHTPSEHAKDGHRYAMEVHLVHENAAGNKAIVGIFLKTGGRNNTLQKLLENVGGAINDVSVARHVRVNPGDFLPQNLDFYHYGGSLTEPPCTENVDWFVMKNTMEVSKAQVRSFANLIGENARPLQKMHWRKLVTTR